MNPKLSLAQFLILLWSYRARGAATCYNAAGQVNTAIYPCDTSADVSPCCGPNDFCLSNGLCLDAGGNNGLSQQGCTSKNWDSPCVKHCPGETGSTSDGNLYLMLCSSFDPSGENPLCCGTDYSCCNSTQNIITTIARFTTMSRAAGAPTTSTASPTAASSTAATNPTSSSSTSTSTATSASQAASSGGVDKSVAIGLGVGIPLGLAFIATLAFLGWQMRKQNKLKESLIASSPSMYQQRRVNHSEYYLQNPRHELAVDPYEVHELAVDPLKKAMT